MSANWLCVKMGCNKYEPTYDFYTFEQMKQLIQDHQGNYEQDLVKMYDDFFTKYEDEYDTPDPVQDEGLPLFNEIQTNGLNYKCFAINPLNDDYQCCLKFWRLYCIDFADKHPTDEIINQINNEIKFYIV